MRRYGARRYCHINFSLKVILTPIALRIFLKEPLHRRVLIGGILGVIGVGVLIYPSLHNMELKGC